MERELRESESKRNSRVIRTMNYEYPEEPYVVDEPPATIEVVEEKAVFSEDEVRGARAKLQKQVSSSSSGNKKRSPPKSPRRSRRDSEAATASEAVAEEKPRHKEKRTTKKHRSSTAEASEPSKRKSSSSKHDPQRRSIRRQAQVEAKASEVARADHGSSGGAIAGADLSDVFDEDSQFQFEDSDMKYIEDRSNCRKK